MTSAKHLQNICVVGNIGSGKSTLARLLGAAIPESIAIPENFDDNPFLELYVAEPKRWAFTNAVRYYYDYVRVYDELTRERTYTRCFVDAGGATNRHVYAPYLAHEAVMTPAENAFYNLLCDMIQRAYQYPEPDAYIFLHAAPAHCFERMQKRGWRYQTENIALTYLETLERYLDAFQTRLQAERIPVLEFDSERIDFTRAEEQAHIVARVREFLGD